MNSLSAQDIPSISADLPSLHDQYCLSRSCDELHLSGSSRCNSSASSQGCELDGGKEELPSSALPAPRRFIRSAEERGKFGFRGSKGSSTLNLSYLATYRQAQGQLEASLAGTCDQDELSKVAREVAKLLAK